MENDGLTPGGSIELEHVGQGTQSYVFGTDRWVVTVRKMSLLGSLARLVTRKQWLGEVRDHLGGLAAPFLLLDDVEFRAPKMTGRYKIIDYRKKMAVARERYETDDFLDHRLSLSDPERALELVEEMVELVERVRARGFYMHDFIMRNFALVDGKLMIVDPGFIAPMAAFRDPAVRCCAYGFTRGLSKDYQRLLGELMDELEEGSELRDRIGTFREALPDRLARLRQRDVPDLESEPGVPIEFEPELEKEIRAAIGSVR